MPLQSKQVCMFDPTPSNSRRKLMRTNSYIPLTRKTPLQVLRPLRNAYNVVMSSASRLQPSRSVWQFMQKATYLHFLLLPALILLVIEMAPPPPSYVSLHLPQMGYGSSRVALMNPLPRPVTSLLPSQGFPFPKHIAHGNAIVACCMNRHEVLKATLPTWRNVANVSEIVLIDWSSDPPLRPLVAQLAADDPRIRVVRVENETSWILTRAFNLAMAASSHDTIIRTDCDYALEKNFLSAHPLYDNTFYAGNYAYARNENEAHLNGAVYIRRDDFFRVGGYDERIQTYGWDDEELYARLQNVGHLQKLNLSYNYVKHVPHDDGARAQRDVKFVQVEIDLNSLLLDHLGIWNASAPPGSRWSVMALKDRFAQVKAVSKPSALKNLVSRSVYEDAWKLALGQRLANDYQMPWDIMETMSVRKRRLLITRLIERTKRQAVNKPARMLFVHCMHGLGNRLRALASAMSFANATNRELVIIWEKDAHIAATFEDLFADELNVMPYFKPKWPFNGYEKWDKAWLHFDFYNYMEMEKAGAIKGQLIRNNPDKHLYFKSAYIMEVADHKLTNWDRDNSMLRKLTPVDEVMDIVRLQETKGLEYMVGIHIRDRTLDRDIKNVDFGAEYGSSASSEMEYWRRKSSYRNFFAEMGRMIRNEPTLKFYVSTDTKELFRTLEIEFPNRIVYTARDCDGRDGRCVRFALVDLLCLAKTKELVGSNWSSFTEAASRFGGKAPRLSGRDFATDKKSF